MIKNSLGSSPLSVYQKKKKKKWDDYTAIFVNSDCSFLIMHESYYLREVCESEIFFKTIEIDQFVLPKQKKSRGPCFVTTVGIVEKYKPFLLRNRSADRVFPIIQDSILPGSKLMSGEWRANNAIQNLPQGETPWLGTGDHWVAFTTSSVQASWLANSTQ